MRITACYGDGLAPQTRYALVVLGMQILGNLFMPPYTPVTSKAQSRKMFALANRGEISLADAKGKTRAANFTSLPEHASGKRGKRPAGKPRLSRR